MGNAERWKVYTIWFIWFVGPYYNMKNKEVMDYVIEGGRLPKPKNIPDELWNLMNKFLKFLPFDIE